MSDLTRFVAVEDEILTEEEWEALLGSGIRAAFDPDQPRDEFGKWTDGGGGGVTATQHYESAKQSYPKLALTERPRPTGLEPRQDVYGGDRVDGLRVRTDIPNTDSIESSLGGEDYEELPGIREVPVADLGLQDYVSRDDRERVEALAQRIALSGEISPLIVVRDHEGSYVLEGNHRARALKKLGKTKVPALVLVHYDDEIRSDKRGAEFNPDQPRDEFGRWTDGGDAPAAPGSEAAQGGVGGAGGGVPSPTPPGVNEEGEVVEKKKKAPKAPPVPLELKKKAYDEVKAGGKFKETAQKYGMTQGQLSGYVWKTDQKKKAIAEKLVSKEEGISAVAPAPSDVPALPKVKEWSGLTENEKMSVVMESGHKWQQKTTGIKKGEYAWFNEQGVQVSAPLPGKSDYRKALDTINYGKGVDPTPATPPPVVTAPGQWPIGPDVERDLGEKYPKVVEKVGKQWAGTLTGDERAAIENYTGSGYAIVNSILRGKADELHLTESHRKNADNEIARISSALAKSPNPPPPELVWRGLSSASAPEWAANLASGDVINMKGFQSSSIRPKFAKDWGEVLLEIKPKKGAYIKNLSSHSHEYEYLLPHDQKYKVHGATYVKFKGHGKVKVVQLEML